jgi:signal transduction histidine kinase
MSTRSEFCASRLLDVRGDQLTAIGRVGLAVLSLTAIHLEGFIPYSAALYFILIGYLLFSLLALALMFRVPPNTSWRSATYLIDFGVVAALSTLSDDATSLFFVFFTFLLLCATLQWNWQGAVVTMLALSAVLWTVTLLDPASLDAELDKLILRQGYLLIVGIMLAYFGAYRERSRGRFAKLAAWPTSKPDSATFRINLAHAAEVLGSSRMLCVWECPGESDQHFLYSENGQTNYSHEPASLPIRELIKPAPVGAVFIAEDGRCLDGRPRLGPEQSSFFALTPTLRTRFCVGTAAIAPLRNEVCPGYLFAAGCHRFDDLLALVTIVANRIGAEIERDYLRRKLQSAAIDRERARMARNIHDGLLQALTATALTLKLCAQNADPQTGSELERVRHNLTEEQARIRRLIESARLPVEGTGFASETRKLLTELGANWNCETVLQVDPAAVEMSPELARHVQLVMAEAVANAARHGGADRVAIELRNDREKLVLSIKDNGSGFLGLDGTYSDEVIATLAVYPHSIYERVKELGGKMTIWSSTEGTRMKIQLPAPLLRAAA